MSQVHPVLQVPQASSQAVEKGKFKQEEIDGQIVFTLSQEIADYIDLIADYIAAADGKVDGDYLYQSDVPNFDAENIQFVLEICQAVYATCNDGNLTGLQSVVKSTVQPKLQNLSSPQQSVMMRGAYQAASFLNCKKVIDVIMLHIAGTIKDQTPKQIEEQYSIHATSTETAMDTA